MATRLRTTYLFCENSLFFQESFGQEYSTAEAVRKLERDVSQSDCISGLYDSSHDCHMTAGAECKEAGPEGGVLCSQEKTGIQGCAERQNAEVLSGVSQTD